MDKPAVLDLERNGSCLATEPSSMAAGELESSKESDRRRYRILKLLAARGSISVQALQSDRNFCRTFSHVSQSTLEDDFRQIEQLLGPFRTVVREPAGGLKLASCSQFPFEKAGYHRSLPDAAHDDVATGEKRRIASFVVNELMRTHNEVVYLSSGTTVFQIALAIAEIRLRVSVLLTDNLAVLALFCQLAEVDERIGETSLELIGGRVNYSRADIIPDPALQQLSAWECSTAIVSATRINPRTGQIFSFRQPEIKRRVICDMQTTQLIIPLAAEKIRQSGGCLIFDPARDRNRSGNPCTIVTSLLEPPQREQLEARGYQVCEVDRPQNSLVERKEV